MTSSLLFALWFFSPAGIANAAPILAAKTPGLRRFNTPLDLGYQLHGKELFGSHKTWRGILSGVIVGVLWAGLQMLLYNSYDWVRTITQQVSYSHASVLVLGFLLALGALLGDLIKSMVKRRVGVPSGRSWFPYDQLDYIIGGLLLSACVVVLHASQYVWVVFVYFGVHLLASYIGYLLKLKDSPI
jgi:CDP-2,3-bis-(O-geranylgeranyl)-sn-glycerol synthase